LVPNTPTTALTNFRERDVIAGGDVFNPFSSWFCGRREDQSIWPDVSGVTDPALHSITTRFNESTAPGLTKQPNLIRYRTYIEPRNTRARPSSTTRLATTSIRITIQGATPSDGSTSREPISSIPRERAEDILTIHDRLVLSNTSRGNAVPFYMQPTLGGSDIDGQPTLRGSPTIVFGGRI